MPRICWVGRWYWHNRECTVSLPDSAAVECMFHDCNSHHKFSSSATDAQEETWLSMRSKMRSMLEKHA